MAAAKSDYELQREKNIEANNAVLRSLGLLEEKEKCEPTVSKAPTVAKRKKEEDVVLLPSRKSARLNNVLTVHQEVYSSSSEEDEDNSSSRKRTKRKAKHASLQASAPSRQSKRRSQKMLPEVMDDFDEDSGDELDNVLFNLTDDHGTDTTYADSFSSFDPYGFDTTFANDVIRFTMPNDGGATASDGTVDDPCSRPIFVRTMFFMDSDTVLCPQF